MTYVKQLELIQVVCRQEMSGFEKHGFYGIISIYIMDKNMANS